jgi:LAO/AO transport system kinase
MKRVGPARLPLSLDAYLDGVRAGDRAVLARAITLIESTNPAHRELAQDLLQRLLPFTGGAHRVGVTGVPGVGKSTLIDQLGVNLADAGHRVAVLAVDPTSRRSGGSVLGDKTRMHRLALTRNAFIRPSPTSGTLGGVARKTRETMALVEAAGFDVVIVETVGVGQSELAVAEMVDFFLVLLLAGGGDELQGLKKGVIEIADMIAINKADAENVAPARRAAADYQNALNLLTPASPNWQPPVITVSARENKGLDSLWAKVCEHHVRMTASGELRARRQAQAVAWLREMVQERLLATLKSNPQVAAKLPSIETDVRDGRLMPTRAADQILAMLGLKTSSEEAP